jgi:hypothetical protein
MLLFSLSESERSRQGKTEELVLEKMTFLRHVGKKITQPQLQQIGGIEQAVVARIAM